MTELVTLVIRRLATALAWALGSPMIAGVGALTSGASRGVAFGLAFAAAALAVLFKPAMSLTLIPTSGRDNSPEALGFILKRWFRFRSYSMDQVLALGVSDFKVSVPLVYLDFIDGQHVGPLLNSDQSVDFVRKVLVALAASKRHADTRLIEDIATLEEYFRRIGR